MDEETQKLVAEAREAFKSWRNPGIWPQTPDPRVIETAQEAFVGGALWASHLANEREAPPLQQAVLTSSEDAIMARFALPELDPEKVAEAIGGHYWQIQRDAHGFDTGGIDCSCGMWSGPNHEGYRPHPAHRAHHAAVLIAALFTLTKNGGTP